MDSQRNIDRDAWRAGRRIDARDALGRPFRDPDETIRPPPHLPRIGASPTDIVRMSKLSGPVGVASTFDADIEGGACSQRAIGLTVASRGVISAGVFHVGQVGLDLSRRLRSSTAADSARGQLRYVSSSKAKPGVMVARARRARRPARGGQIDWKYVRSRTSVTSTPSCSNS